MEQLVERIRNFIIENTGSQWAQAMLSIAGGIVAGMVFATILSKLQVRFRRRAKTLFRLLIVEYAKLPVALLFIWGGFEIGLGKLTLSAEAEYWRSKTFFIALVWLISWCIMKVLDTIIAHHTSAPVELPSDTTELLPAASFTFLQTDIKPVLRRVVKIVMFILPLAVIVKSFGYDITAILAGLGIGGAALALAARDILASFFGSIAVLTDKPFRVGDRIRFIDKNFEAIDGFINEIRFRTTRLTTLDNRSVIVPNALFSSMPVQNVSSEPHIRMMQTINIRSANNYAKTCQAIELLRNLAPSGVRFGANNIAALSSTGLTVHKITFIYFIAKGEDYFPTVNAVNLEILRVFEAAEIIIA